MNNDSRETARRWQPSVPGFVAALGLVLSSSACADTDECRDGDKGPVVEIINDTDGRTIDYVSWYRTGSDFIGVQPLLLGPGDGTTLELEAAGEFEIEINFVDCEWVTPLEPMDLCRDQTYTIVVEEDDLDCE